MPDQAAGLRSLFARRRPSLLIVAGADACKAAIAVHYAREAAASSRATVLIDGTAGDAAKACDIACRYELSHVLAGDKTLADVLRPLTPHLLLLPAARALSRFATLTTAEHARLSETFSTGIAQALADAGAEDTQVDLIVVHAEESRAVQAVEAFGRDARVVIVASESAMSLRGAYLEMKALSQQQDIEQFEIVVPHFDDAPVSRVAFTNLAATARRFLEIELQDGGSVRLERPCATPVARASLSTPTPFATPFVPPTVTADDTTVTASSVPSSDPLPSTTTAEVHHAAVA